MDHVTLNIGTRLTLIYSGQMLAGTIVTILSGIYLSPSFDLMDLMTFNGPRITPTLIFMVGSVVAIMGLHEICHCLYCKIKGIEIVGGITGLRDLGIKVKACQQEVRLSSLFSIPITATISVLLLPLWVFVLNTLVACIYCTDDIQRFLRNRAHGRI